MSAYQLIHGDALNVLAGMEDCSIDLLVTDPAYESLEKHRSVGTTTRLSKSSKSSSEWFPVVSNDYLVRYLQECFRVMRPGTHGYLLCDQETGFFLKPEIEKIGFKFWKALTWDKVNLGMGYHYRGMTEWALFFEKVERKGKHRQLVDLKMPDIFRVKSLRGAQYYPTEKPVGLLASYIIQSSQPGDNIFDGFCGSGSTGIAGLDLGRNVIMCDIHPPAIEAATTKLDFYGTPTELIQPRKQLQLVC